MAEIFLELKSQECLPLTAVLDYCTDQAQSAVVRPGVVSSLAAAVLAATAMVLPEVISSQAHTPLPARCR